MSFTYPAFLFALSAIAIPIIIHLFNFRKFKTVYFSNIRFLKEVKQETQAKSKLKHLLVLAARILAITFLVLAFAQPFIPVENRKVIVGDKAVSIFIDNSFSMEAINKNGTLLDEARKRASEIVAAFKPTDRFQLLTNDFEAKHQRLVNKDEFLEMLDDVKISPSVHNIAEIASRQTDMLDKAAAKSKVAFVISDFQKTISTIDQLKVDTSITFNWIPLVAAEKSNVYIDTCWFETPVRQANQLEQLHVRIKNVSDKVIENNAIKLFVNEQQKTPASFNVDKDSETEVVLSFASKETGLLHCRVELNDYPVTFDDKFYFSFEVAKNIPLLCINGTSDGIKTVGSSYLNKLFANDSLFLLSNTFDNKLDYSTLPNYRLIILNELKSVSSGLALELKRFLSSGGSVLVFPSKLADLNSYKEFLIGLNANYYEHLDTTNTKVDKLNLESEMYKDVFDNKITNASSLNLPIVNEHFVISKSSRSNEEYLMKMQNGDVFFSEYGVGMGRLYLSAVPLQMESSNFAQHSVFVPTLYKAAIYSQAVAPLFYTIAADEAIKLNSAVTGENVYHVKGIKSDVDIIPEHKVMDGATDIYVHNQITSAGNYNLLMGKEMMTGVSFNFNRKESDLNCYTAEELQKVISDKGYSNIGIIETGAQSLQQTLTEIEQGKKLWKMCIVLALLFLAAEVALLRFMKG